MKAPISLTELLASAGVPIGAGAVVDLPPGTPEWVRFVFVFVGAVVAPFLYRAAPPVVARFLAGRRAKKQALAAAKRARAAADAEQAQRILADGNDGNDAIARALLEGAHKRLDEADALDADAAEINALGSLGHTPDRPKELP
jgi:hypothetical protein